MSRYQLIERIGSGGMAEVWSAWRRLADGTRELVAIKKILPKHVHKPEALLRLDREAALSLEMCHPHVVKVVDYVKLDGERWIVMEHIDGLTLADLGKARRPSFPLLRSIQCSVLNGLGYIHECGYLHRDISPKNIMISCQGNVKIMDLGLLKELDSSRISAHFKGTPAYAPPEALKKKRSMHRRISIQSRLSYTSN